MAQIESSASNNTNEASESNTSSKSSKPKFQPSALDFDDPIANALYYFTSKHGYRVPVQPNSLLLIKLSGIEQIKKTRFKIKGVFLDSNNQTVESWANVTDVDCFLLIGPLSQAKDASDDSDLTDALMNKLGDLSIETINYNKYQIGETVFRYLQKFFFHFSTQMVVLKAQQYFPFVPFHSYRLQTLLSLRLVPLLIQF